MERVMGFVTDRVNKVFLWPAPLLEETPIESGFTLTELWFSVTRPEQRTPFATQAKIDPMRN